MMAQIKKNADLERNPLLRRDMDNETGGHSKTGGIRNVDMAKNGKNQLDGTYIERRSVNIGRREKISYIHNQSKTKKLDGTPAKRRLSSERNNGGKNGGEERKRKTKAKTIGLDTVNSRKKLKTGRSGAIGRLDLPEGRELKEEE